MSPNHPLSGAPWPVPVGGRRQGQFRGAGPVLILALIMNVVFSGLAFAAPSDSDSTLIIHKLTQGEDFGEHATGLEAEVPGAPIAGVSFSATAVPGAEIATAGVTGVAEVTVAQALAAAGDAEPAAQGSTDGEGLLELSGLAPALYLVQETGGPEGLVPVAPFLVPLPFPADDGTWLTNVHVYPKNARATVSLEVGDASTITSGDQVSWTSHTSIPLIADTPRARTQPMGTGAGLGAYAVRNVLNPGLQLIETPSLARVSLRSAEADPLVAGDYTESLETRDGRQSLLVRFTVSGLVKLASARAADPGAEVIITYLTTIPDSVVAPSGVYTNEAMLYAAAPTVQGSEPGLGEPLDRATQVTKFGDVSVTVHQRGRPEVRVAGARARLYLSATDALAGQNPIVVAGIDEWTSDSDGSFTVKGLRLSDFADGLDRAPCTPAEHPCLYRDYYVILSYIPPGWRGEKMPVAAVVSSTSVPVEVDFGLWRDGGGGPGKPDGPNGSGGSLPVTGAQVAGLASLAGLSLLLGTVLVRRRKQHEAEQARR